MVRRGAGGGARKHILQHVGKRPRYTDEVSNQMPLKKRFFQDDHSDSDSDAEVSENKDSSEDSEKDATGAIDEGEDSDESDSGKASKQNNKRKDDDGDDGEDGDMDVTESTTAALFADSSDDDDDGEQDKKGEETKVSKNASDEQSSESDEEDEEFEYDLDKTDNQVRSDSPAASSEMDEDDNVAEDDEEDIDADYDDGFDEDGYGDEDDRAYLRSLTSKQRSQIIFERLEARDKKREMLKLQRELRKYSETTQSNRRPQRKAAITAELENQKIIRAAEERKRKAKKKEEQQVEADSSDSEMEDKVDPDDLFENRVYLEVPERDFNKAKNAGAVYDERREEFYVPNYGGRKSRVLPAKFAKWDKRDEGDVYDSEDYGEEDYNDVGEDSTEFRDDDEDVSLEDVERLRISRRFLAKHIDETKFLRSILPKCFVRFFLGTHDGTQVYRVCEIIRIEKQERSQPYRFENIPDVNLRLRISFPGSRKEKLAKLSRISNKPIRKDEFLFWQQSSREASQQEETAKEPHVEFRWSKRRASKRLKEFQDSLQNHKYEDNEELARLIHKRITRRGVLHNAAFRIVELQTKIGACKADLAQDRALLADQDSDGHVVRPDNLDDRIKLAIANTELDDRLRSKLQKLVTSNDRYFDVSNALNLMVQAQSSILKKMQKELKQAKVQQAREKKESQNLSAKESYINYAKQIKKELARSLQQHRYRTQSRTIAKEHADNRFRRYETRPKSLWVTKTKKDKSASGSNSSSRDSMQSLNAILSPGMPSSKKNNADVKRKKKRKKKKKKKTSGMSLAEWRAKSRMRNHGGV